MIIPAHSTQTAIQGRFSFVAGMVFLGRGWLFSVKNSLMSYAERSIF